MELKKKKDCYSLKSISENIKGKTYSPKFNLCFYLFYVESFYLL
jgi:hypothetical protein